jgi:hypothetical protein
LCHIIDGFFSFFRALLLGQISFATEIVTVWTVATNYSAKVSAELPIVDHVVAL